MLGEILLFCHKAAAPGVRYSVATAGRSRHGPKVSSGQLVTRSGHARAMTREVEDDR